MKRMNDPTSPESSSGGTPPHDPVWEDIRVLLREANQPPDVRPERLQTLRWRALQRVQIDQVSAWGRVREWMSFWVDSIVGQSGHARFMQIAAAALVGAALAYVALRANLVGMPFGNGNSPMIAQSANPADSSTRSVPSEMVANTTSPSPEGSPVVRIEKSSASISDASLAAASPTAPPLEGGPTAIPGSGDPLVVQPVSAGALQQVDAPVAPPQSYEYAVLEDIEKLRFKLNLSGDTRYMADVDRIQSTIIESMKNRQQNVAEGEQMRARRLFREGELAMKEQRYVEAITSYSRVVDEFKGGYWAFMAQLLIANIEFEHLNEFGSALDAYRKCLDNYPSHFFSEDNLTQIKGRVEFLTQNSENNWHALRLYRDAQKSSPEVARHHLMDLMELYPESRLAGSAARALANLAANDLEGRYIDPDQVIQVLQQAVDLNPTSPQAAEIQYAIADILKRRLFKPNLALPAFQKVLTMNPSTELASAVNTELQELHYLRSATPTP